MQARVCLRFRGQLSHCLTSTLTRDFASPSPLFSVLSEHSRSRIPLQSAPNTTSFSDKFIGKKNKSTFQIPSLELDPYIKQLLKGAKSKVSSFKDSSSAVAVPFPLQPGSSAHKTVFKHTQTDTHTSQFSFKNVIPGILDRLAG